MKVGTVVTVVGLEAGTIVRANAGQVAWLDVTVTFRSNLGQTFEYAIHTDKAPAIGDRWNLTLEPAE